MSTSVFLAEYLYPPSLGSGAPIAVHAPDMAPVITASIDVHAPDAAHGNDIADPAHLEIHAPELYYAAQLPLAHIRVTAKGVRTTPMSPNYNPRSPCVLGPEWFPSADSFAWIDDDANAQCFALVADTDDEIASVWLMIGCWLGKQNTSLEIYDITTGPPPLPALTWQTFYPTADRHVAVSPWSPGAYGPATGYTPIQTDMWSVLDSVSLTPSTWPGGFPIDNDALVFNIYGQGYDFAVGHGGTSGIFAGRWITRVRSHYVVAQYFDYDRPGGVTITPYIWLEGRKFFGTPISFESAQGPLELDYDWYVNPSSGLPWTPDDISGFDPSLFGSDNGLGFKMNPTGSSNNLGTLLQAQLWVESAASDPRLAMAAITRPRSGMKGGTACKQGWMEYDLVDPQDATATTVPLVVGRKYLFVFRKDGLAQNTSLAISCTADTSGPPDPRRTAALSGATAPLETSLQTLGPPYWTTYSGPLGLGEGRRQGVYGKGVRLDGASRRVVDLGIETGVTPGIALMYPDGGGELPSRDSQPYATTSPTQGIDAWPDLGEWFDNSPINVNRSMEQEITAVATDDYGWLSILVCLVAGSTDGDLLVKVKRRSDNVQMGATVTITSDDLTAAKRTWQRVGMRLSADATLTNGVQYYLEITSVASEDQGWLVQCMNSGYEDEPTGPPTGTNAAAGWGAGVDLLTFADPLMEQFGFTPPAAPGNVVALVNLSVVPDAPADFAAVAVEGTCCLGYVTLSWTSVAATCGDFYAYELQRLNGSYWQTIAYITDEAVSYFKDYEAMLNVEESYRMRMVREDGVPSDWTATEVVTLPSSCCGLTFTSNEAPELGLFYADLGETRDFGFPSTVTTYSAHNRDYQVVFRELEDRGTAFKTKLRVRSGRGVTEPALVGFCQAGCDDFDGMGDTVFDPIRDLARAGLSYICVRNEAGNRWFASLRITAGSWTQHGSEAGGGWASYTADAEIIEVTNVPSWPDARAAS